MHTYRYDLSEPKRFDPQDCWVEKIERRKDELIFSFGDEGFRENFGDSRVSHPEGKMILLLPDASTCVYVRKRTIRSTQTRDKYVAFDKFCKLVHRNRFCLQEMMIGYHSSDVEVRGTAPFQFSIEISGVRGIRFEYR